MPDASSRRAPALASLQNRSNVKLLVTRPAPDGERTAARLRALGHEAMLAGVLRIEPIPAPELGTGPWSAVLVTSAHAVEAIVAHPRRAEIVALPAFAVGARTARLLGAAGFAAVDTAPDAAGLVARVRGYPTHRPPVQGGGIGRGRLLYLAGADRSRDLAAELAPDGLAVDTIEVYRAVPASRLPPEVTAALSAGTLDGVLHYSRRSAEALIAAARAEGVLDQVLRLTHFCLSGRVAEPLAAAGAAGIRVAARPDEAGLIELVAAAR
jgi:uroporphyrinogen-III synthase